MIKKTVCVLGEGAWGTAVATLLAHNGYTVKLWCYHPEIVPEITGNSTNKRYMPNITLSPLIEPTNDIAYAARGVSWIFEAIPVQYLRSVLLKIVPYVTTAHTWVILSKGIEEKTLLLPTQIIETIIGIDMKKAVLSGPSFARDLVEQQLTGCMIAADNNSIAQELKKVVDNTFFITNITNDTIGVQICAALKNPIVLAAGILEGAGYTDNTKALYITRCFEEIKIVLTAAGSNKESAYNLAGIGDLILTAYGKHSRNREVGYRLGRGESLESIIATTGYTPEGINTALSIQALAKKLGCTVPLCSRIYDIIHHKITIKEFIQIISGVSDLLNFS